MIKITETEIYGWRAAIRGMRNPKESWNKSDSRNGKIGPNDLKLMKQLSKAGTDHSKYMRYIIVACDISAPMYWWKEFDTYKVGTVRNSCSTMHKIHAKEFTLDDFSTNHLEPWSLVTLEHVINQLNTCRESFVHTDEKKYWWQMIQLLPSSFNQKATVLMSYQVLKNMYHARKNHKLDEWHEFCDWIRSLPCSEIITMEE